MAKVVVADDDLTSRMVIVKGVELLGHIVLQASNGTRAWTIMDDNPDIKMLISDVAMPEMDGKALVRLVRGNSRFEKLPIILVSGVIGPKKIADLLDLGASVFLPKPVSISELHQYVVRAIGRVE